MSQQSLYPISEVLRELRFNRPAWVQDLIDEWVIQAHSREILEDKDGTWQREEEH
jgi:hypothetical protein